MTLGGPQHAGPSLLGRGVRQAMSHVVVDGAVTPSRAIADYDKAASLAPSLLNPYFNKGQALEQMGRPYIIY